MTEISSIVSAIKYLDQSLYAGHNLLTYKLLLEIIEFNKINKPVTIKLVCNQSKGSFVNARKHLNYLIRDGWVLISRDHKDARQQLLHPSAKLKLLANELGLLKS